MNLKAIHLINEGSYIVTRGYHSLEVDGFPVHGNTFVVSDPSSIKSVRKIRGVITHYVNEQGDIKSVECFTSEKNALLVNATEDQEYSGCYSFSDLDEEFAYKRFCKTWTSVYDEDRVEKEPVTFELTEVRTNSGDPDIKSLWNAPNMEAKAHLYALDRNGLAIEAFDSKCLKLGLKFVIPNHSGVRYATIDGKYLFDDNMDFGRKLFVGTLEQCKQEKESIRRRVNRAVDLYVAKKNNVDLVNSAEVLGNLYTLHSQVSKITPMKVSRSVHLASTKLIRDLITKIENGLLIRGG